MERQIDHEIRAYIQDLVGSAESVAVETVMPFVRSFSQGDLQEFTARLIRDQVAAERRVARLRAERAAEQENLRRIQAEAHRARCAQEEEARRDAWRTKARSRWSKRDYAAFSATPAEDTDKMRVLRLDREEAERARNLTKQLGQIISDYGDRLRIEWTAELLSTSFGLPDGSVTTWGDATAEQHQERLEMYAGQAKAGIEGAARHQKAIEDLRRGGAETLNALTAQEVAA